MTGKRQALAMIGKRLKDPESESDESHRNEGSVLSILECKKRTVADIWQLPVFFSFAATR
jgi:hypothetical protein